MTIKNKSEEDEFEEEFEEEIEDEEGVSVYDSKEIVDILQYYLDSKEYKKPKSFPTFNHLELRFILDYIFYKEYVYRKVPYAVAGLIEENHMLGYPISPTNYRYTQFYKHFILSGGNATQAAMAAGYSPRTAKQQGYRLLKNYRFRYMGS